MPTVSIHRACSDDITFTMVTLYENDLFAPALHEPLRERTLFGEFFREVIALLSGESVDPQASRPSDVCPNALLYDILACLINMFMFKCMIAGGM